MGNIIISIKRFFQNKNTVTIFAILIAVGIIYFAYNFRIKKSTEPVNVPYATQEIGPRTLITQEMVSTKAVPGGIVTKDVLTNPDNIIGKYVINTGVVPKDGLFFNSMVIDGDESLTSIADDIPDGQVTCSMEVDLDSTFGNSIYPGNYIDIYFKTNDETGRVWIGKFIESIRVLAVTDADGKNVFETNTAPERPAFLKFNVNEDVYSLFNTIQSMGIVLFPVQRNANYSKNPKETRIVGVEFQKYISGNTVDSTIINGGKK